MWADLRLSKNKRRVHIDHGVTRRPHPLQGLAQKNCRVSAFPLGIGGRKQRADIRRSHGAEQGIGQRMQKHVAIGVPTQALWMSQERLRQF